MLHWVCTWSLQIETDWNRWWRQILTLQLNKCVHYSKILHSTATALQRRTSAVNGWELWLLGCANEWVHTQIGWKKNTCPQPYTHIHTYTNDADELEAACWFRHFSAARPWENSISVHLTNGIYKKFTVECMHVVVAVMCLHVWASFLGSLHLLSTYLPTRNRVQVQFI